MVFGPFTSLIYSLIRHFLRLTSRRHTECAYVSRCGKMLLFVGNDIAVTLAIGIRTRLNWCACKFKFKFEFKFTDRVGCRRRDDTYQSLVLRPNVRCNFWPVATFRFWIIYAFSVRSVSAGAVWQMPNLHWKHMNCVNGLRWWEVTISLTHTYVSGIVHERSLVVAQSVYRHRTDMVRHYTDRTRGQKQFRSFFIWFSSAFVTNQTRSSSRSQWMQLLIWYAQPDNKSLNVSIWDYMVFRSAKTNSYCPTKWRRMNHM